MKQPLVFLLVLASFALNMSQPLQAQPKSNALPAIHLPLPKATFYNAQFFRANTEKNFSLEEQIKAQFPEKDFGKLKLVSKKISPAGVHYLFTQTILNIPVYKSQLKVNTTKSGEIESIIAGLYPLTDTDLPVKTTTLSKELIQYFITKKTPKNTVLKSTQEQVFYINNGHVLPGIVLTYGHEKTSIGAKEVLLSSASKVLDEYDLIFNYKHSHSSKINKPAIAKVRAQPLDTAATAFIVSPAATQNHVHEKPEILSTPSAKVVRLPLRYLNGRFILQSPYCIVREFDPPFRPVISTSSPFISLLPGQPGFEQVNTLYHITTWQQYVHQLGFTNLAEAPVQVDANGWNGQDQSSYSAFTNTLSFGTGGVEDAIDPQVIIHEYSHAIARSASAAPALSYERKVLEEANADYFAVSYKCATDSTDWQRIFTNDGHNQYWSGRLAVSDKQYPAGITGKVYSDASLWTATLMQIQHRIGRETTDKLLLQSLYSYASYMQIPDAAQLLLQADEQLYNGTNQAAIQAIFSARGITTTLATASAK